MMPEKNILIDLAAGGISGAVAKTITAPIEKIKLAIQNQASNPRIISGEMQPYTGMVDCFSRHVSELGVSSLWRGNVANCVRYVPTAACNLGFKDAIKRMFPKYNQKTDFAMFAGTQVLSGSLAGAVTNTIVYPLIYVRTVLGADLGAVRKYSGMGDCIMKTVKANGPLSLYNGILPSTAGIVVYRGTQFGLQDTIKAFNPYQKDFTMVGIASKFVVAQVAVSASGIVAYPFDTVQRRMQIEASKPKEQQMYTSVPDCIKKLS
jgi:solute carrier family 25 (adenine nucleotide translocator) protein 4/5/6/31